MASTPGTDGHPHGSLHQEDVAHEHSDISVRGVIWFVVVLTVLVVVIQVSMVGLFKLYTRIEVNNDPYVAPVAAPAAFPAQMPGPSLQTTPWVDLKAFRADEDALLGSYGWVDQKGGVARLPIDKAKALLVQRGIPARPEAQGDPREGTHAYAYGEATGGTAIPAGAADLSSPPAPAATKPGDAAPKPPPAPKPGDAAPKSPQPTKAGGAL